MISPGPDFLLVTKNSLTLPRRQALATAFGIVVGCLVHATYCILGLALVITKSVLLFSLIRYLGACYLIYLGIKCLFSKASRAEIQQGKARRILSTRAAFLEGFLCNVLNPKLAVFLLSMFTQFISLDATLLQKSLVAGIFVLESAIYWPLLVLMLQSSAIQKFFEQSRVLLDRFCGALLLYLGVKVALSKS